MRIFCAISSSSGLILSSKLYNFVSSNTRLSVFAVALLATVLTYFLFDPLGQLNIARRCVCECVDVCVSGDGCVLVSLCVCGCQE